MALFPKLEGFVANLDLDSLTEERKSVLQPLVDFVQHKAKGAEDVRINFICTHNSRRSHLSQIWAQAMAHHFGLKNVQCYSAGTEATALYPMVAETLRNAGFEVQPLSEGNNPVYYIKYSESAHPLIGFSKTLDHDFNPVSGFAAVMTCDSANEACPFVPGAEKRIPITFEDPKAFDGTPQQAEKYSERSRQIATEMCYVFSLIQ
ncbi:protein-tyrosine-phosphatase [Flagellimonas amoyensis]|uniref:arsenate reductase/protein-tyrosine-phosphatase family protein n=1 Tax=Flagellimonas amoyensis TaxID=2169401 RepID=UPI000D339CFC|nr:protein-tyrosine-phosphatase [Allomuricauda amoyensis]